MSHRKPQKEIDKAIANLMKYSEQEPWSERQQQFYGEMLIDAAARVGVPVDEFGQTMEDQGFMDMIFGYLFELFATRCWDNDDFCLIEDYVKRRGWRETSYAKRYLVALSKSEIELWEVVTVNAGHWVDVRPFGSTSKVIRVFERAGSQNLKRWDCLAARVISLDGKLGFGGGILSFSPDQALEVPALIERACQRVIESLKEMRSEDAQLQWPDEDIEKIARTAADEQLPDILFSLWTCQTYLALTRPMPTLLNREGHLLQWSKVKFPIEIANKGEIERRLHAAAHLDFNRDAKDWIWLSCEKDNIEISEATILGHLSLTDHQLIATVNSVERADAVKGYLTALLGTLMGTPLAVHENFQAKMEDYRASGLPSAEPLDVPDLITASLNRHYQKILDEPIPALNNLTPRACALKNDQHPLLIQWLKSLENTTFAAPQMAHYDFTWMWEELGLTYSGADE